MSLEAIGSRGLYQITCFLDTIEGIIDYIEQSTAWSIYAVNWCVSRWIGHDTMDVINFFLSRPGGLTREKVQISWKNYFFVIYLFILNIYLKSTNHV